MPVSSSYSTSAWYVCLQKKQWIISMASKKGKIVLPITHQRSRPSSLGSHSSIGSALPVARAWKYPFISFCTSAIAALHPLSKLSL